MNFSWLIPSLLISYLGNDRVPKSLSKITGERHKPVLSTDSSNNASTLSNFSPRYFEPPVSHPDDLDYLSPLFTSFLLFKNESTLISPLAIKLRLTTTSLTAFAQQWPLPFNRLGATEDKSSSSSIPFYVHHHSSLPSAAGQQQQQQEHHLNHLFSRPPFLTRVLHNSRHLHHPHFGATFVEVPFAESTNNSRQQSFSMIIALPDQPQQNSSSSSSIDNLNSLIQNLSQDRALSQEVLPHLRPTPVNLTLPAFQLTSSTLPLDLVDSLSSSSSKLNLNRLFPSITTSLHSVQQLFSLSLTSTGVYSSASGEGESENFSNDDDNVLPPPPPQPIYVHAEVSVLVDRPFLFLITETIPTTTDNGRRRNNKLQLEVLYAGTVLNP